MSDDPAPDLPDPDEVYANNLRTCAMLGVEPVPRDRALTLVDEWSAAIGPAMERDYSQRVH